MATVCGALGVGMCLFFAVVNLLRGRWTGTSVDLVIASLVLVAIVVARRWRTYELVGWILLAALTLLTLAIGASGIVQAWFWAATCPALLLYLVGARRGIYMSTMLGLLMAAVLYWRPPTVIDPWPGLSILMSYGTVTVFAWMSERLRAAYEGELRQLSLVDQLTGAYNRRKFDEALSVEDSRFHRYGRPATLVLFDVDRFKQVNDHYGHDIGDQALVQLTARIQQAIRDVDLLVRLGGDEFAILAPETTDPRELGERVRRAAAEVRLEGSLTLTVTVGVATILPDDTPTTLYRRADDALYAAKRAGRNRVVLATDQAA